MTDARGGAGQSRAARRSRAAAAPVGSGRRSRRQRRDWAGASAEVEKGEGKVTDRHRPEWERYSEAPPIPWRMEGLPVSSDARGGSRTHDLFLRREALYPAELRTQIGAVARSVAHGARDLGENLTGSRGANKERGDPCPGPASGTLPRDLRRSSFRQTGGGAAV